MTDEAPDGTADREATQIGYPANAVHLLRTSQMAQISLSQMADTKASILMGATFVIFTITIGQARQGGAAIPLLILGGAAFFAAIFAVLAVLPKTSNHKPTAKSNLLFFGVFSQMAEEEFVDEVMRRLRTEDSLYRTMARDIHQAGSVLQNKKYRFLGYAYRIFLVGLVASCASYVILYMV
jgi:pycsar effector protein